MHLPFHLLPSFLSCWLGQTTLPPLCPPVSCCWLRIWLYLPPSRGFQAEVTARLMDSRDHKQVAGGPASVHPTQRCQSAGQTPAASPLVGLGGSTPGSGPVRPALRLTRLSLTPSLSWRSHFIQSWFQNSHLKRSHKLYLAGCLFLLSVLAVLWDWALSEICMAASQFLSLGGWKPWCWAKRAVLSITASIQSLVFLFRAFQQRIKQKGEISNFGTKLHETITKATDFKPYVSSTILW